MSWIPAADPRRAFLRSRKGLEEAFARVLDRGRYILGEEVEGFEREWADYCEVPHAVAVSSGTDALALALRAVGVGRDDEVLVPAMTAIATWMAVSEIGAVPVGVDIEPRRNAMDPELARAAVSPRTRAIVAVHLFGQPADVRAIAAIADEAGIPLIEDAAQAHGARAGGHAVGGFGAAAAFSFYPTKNLAAMGDAGAVTMRDEALCESVRARREYGWGPDRHAGVEGINARMDELQAAFLRVMLRSLGDANSRRREIAERYLAALPGLPGLELPSPTRDSEHAWHLFVIRHPRRDELASALAAAGVGSGVHYSPPPHLNRVYRLRGMGEGMFPVAERHAATALSLPMYPDLSDAAVEQVISAVREAVTALG